nr:serine/arginine repetitive matrix protein 2-like isoform X2 [Procambarus clarkii]
MVGVGTRGAAWALGGAYAPPHGAGHNTLLDVLGGEPGGPPLDGASLTVALDVVQAWAVLITVGFTLVLFIFLAFCVCAKKDDGYDEFELTQGITTVKVCHDGGENGLGSYPRINGSNTPRASDEASEASSRCTLKRELPAIPLSAEPDPASLECTVERTQSQHSSDLYAAVGETNDAGGSGIGKVIGGVQVLPAGAIGPDGRAAIIRDPTHTSPTEPAAPPHVDGVVGSGIATAAHPYAKVKKNHPYAHVKLPKKDHPYAKVVRDDSEDPETDTDNYDDPKAITKDKSSGWDSEGGYEPAPPVPEKRFDIEEESVTTAGPPDSGLMTTSITSASSGKGPSSPRSPHLNARSSVSGSAPSPTSPHSIGAISDRPPSTEIQAALAISGRTPANEEMPYMTPPLHHTEEAGIEVTSQQNFSGDSQDSRGYTSISVREPLAAIKAQTQGSAAPQSSTVTQPLEGEGYYMTVSDDSADEMYACIYEGTRGVGSETYAQIEPRSTPPPPPPPMPSPPHAPSTPSPLSTRGGSQPPPAPPSVDSLRHVVHSRQASSSSAASTVMGSPGAEKRGTRSPLPPLPQGDTSLYSGPSPQPPHSPPRSVPSVERPTQRALEEMYAKVMKKQRPGHSRGDSSGGGGESDAGSVSSSRRGSVDIGGARWGSHASSPPTTPRQSVDLGAMTRSLVETRNHEVISSISRAKSYEKAGVWGSTTQHPQPTLPNPNYETIPQLPTNFYSGGSDPGYETVKNSEPPYASVERPEENYPGYETVKQTSDVDSEPGYETLKHREYEPGYETVTGEAKLESLEPGYETVSHDKNQEEDEPGYESVIHHRAEVSDPGYEIVKGKPTSEFGDPGYEELQGAIHHIRTTSEHDPNYEQLKFTSRRSSDGDAEPGYEVVKKVVNESTYEFVHDYDTQENYPPYEKIDKPVKETNQVTPLYAVVQKGNTSPEKKLAKAKSPVEEERRPRVIGLLESDLDNYPPPINDKDLQDTLTKESLVKDRDFKLPLKKPESPHLPYLENKSPSPLKSPDKASVSSGKRLNESPPAIKSPKGSPPLVKSAKGSSPTTKSPKGSPPQMKSPTGSPPVMKSPRGSPSLINSPDKGSPPLVKSPDKGAPPLMKSPDKGSPPLMKSPDKGSPPMVKSPDKGSPPLVKSPDKGSPPLVKSPDKGSPPLVKSPYQRTPPLISLDTGTPPLSDSSDTGSPPLMESPDKGSPPLMESPDKGSPPVLQSPDKETPPLMKSPSPDMESPPLVKSPNGSPQLLVSRDEESLLPRQSPEGPPPVPQSPEGPPPVPQSPEGPPPVRQSPEGPPPVPQSPEGPPPVPQSPEGPPPVPQNPEGPPPVPQSPEGPPPVPQSPEGPPPVPQAPEVPPPVPQSPEGPPPVPQAPEVPPPVPQSPEGPPPVPQAPEVPPPVPQSPEGPPPVPQSPEGPPPVPQAPEVPPPVSQSPEGSPPVPLGPEGPPPVPWSPEGPPPVPPSPDGETPPLTRSPSPDIEFLPLDKVSDGASSPSTRTADQNSFLPEGMSSMGQAGQPMVFPIPSSVVDMSPPSLASEERKSSVLLADSYTESSPQQEESNDKQVSPTETRHFAQQPCSSHMENSITLQESQDIEASQQLVQSGVKETAFPIEGIVHGQSFSTLNENRNVIVSSLEEIEALPPEPPSPERESSPVAFSSLGSVDLPAPLLIEETENQPQETVNPLYMLDSLNNGVDQESTPLVQTASIIEHDTSSGMCSDLPPPPPPVMDEDDSAFTNDLPPPLPEASPLMPRTSTLCEDTPPPPPLVAPPEVEGLDELLNLANMGSSSSGSTAGQPGSIHGSSEKDSDSPQESDITQLEGALIADELPPPPPLSEPSEPGTEHDSDEELDNSVSSGYECGFTAGGITVTVNPISDVEENPESPVNEAVPCETSQAAAAAAPPIVAAAISTNSGGSQSSSSGSGSQDTGSGSVESVVTVECAVGDAGIHGRQQSSDSSSPESRHLDPHEQITEV